MTINVDLEESVTHNQSLFDRHEQWTGTVLMCIFDLICVVQGNHLQLIKSR